MIIQSLLDTDWYKLTMAQVAFFNSPLGEQRVKYKFYNRGNTKFPKGFAKALTKEIKHLSTLRLTSEEYDYLKSNPNIYIDFLNWFARYRFNPNQVRIMQSGSNLYISIEGDWLTTIFWEVPLMAIISELYYQETNQYFNLHYCSPSSVFAKNLDKKANMIKFPVADFGTRRRYSFDSQYLMLSVLSSKLIGTSNVYMAFHFDIPVVGTYAHEAVMAMERWKGFNTANQGWLNYWRELYGKQMNIALTDTLTTDFFFRTIGKKTLRLLDGFRQDSGDPIEIGKKMVKFWKKWGINPKEKKIIFSDGLDLKKATKIWNTFKNVTNPIFGIGTNLTNDVGVKPLNMVIKLDEFDGRKVYKLSDSKGKYTGDKKEIEQLKKDLKI